MDILLDTCAFLFLCQGEGLTTTAQLAVRDPNNKLLLSIVSIWEMAIKSNVARPASKRLQLRKPLDVFVSENVEHYGIEVLPIGMPYFLKVASFVEEHGDPFDRLIIAQGLVHSMPIVTRDRQWEAFGVQVIW